MLRQAPLALVAIYLVGYGLAVGRIPSIGWLHPRGGILGFLFYLLFATGLIWFGTRRQRDQIKAFQMTVAGWVLLLMPPLWWLILTSQT